MNYSEKDLQQIEKLASLYMKITDIALILDVPEEQLRYDVSEKGSQAYIAYRKGKISTKLQLHKQETALAQVGSPLALENMRKNLLDMEDDE